MPPRHPAASRRSLPVLWLVTDARNDAVLEAAIRRLPIGAGIIFRHLHLNAQRRASRFAAIRRRARARRLVLLVAGPPGLASRWRAQGCWGPPSTVRRATGLLRVGAVHDARELAQARRAGCDAVTVSPVFATRTHPGAPVLGTLRFRLMARTTGLPAIALGGMDRRRFAALRGHGAGRASAWAAIDELSPRRPVRTQSGQKRNCVPT